MVIWNNSKSKKRAGEIIEAGQVNDIKEYDRIVKTLSVLKKDQEAIDLLVRLNAIKKETAPDHKPSAVT